MHSPKGGKKENWESGKGKVDRNMVRWIIQFQSKKGKRDKFEYQARS